MAHARPGDLLAGFGEAAGRPPWLELEKSEVEMLLELARETEAAGTDAKAEALLDLIYKLQQEEGDPALKVLIFTEFVPTQAMLADYIESRGFSVATLNGSMDLEARTRAQQVFSKDVRVLISTDAGGEGLNLQFCHVIVNFDMPWNPMRIEQRIGRVDRTFRIITVSAWPFLHDRTVQARLPPSQRGVLNMQEKAAGDGVAWHNRSQPRLRNQTRKIFRRSGKQLCRSPSGAIKITAGVPAERRRKGRSDLRPDPSLNGTEQQHGFNQGTVPDTELSCARANAKPDAVRRLSKEKRNGMAGRTWLG